VEVERREQTVAPSAAELLARARADPELDDVAEAELLAHPVHPGGVADRLPLVLSPNVQVRVELDQRRVRVVAPNGAKTGQRDGVLAAEQQPKTMGEHRRERRFDRR